MKIYTVYVALPIVCFVISCSTAYKISHSSEEFMPLSVGNKWYYETAENSKMIKEVVSQNSIDGNMYYRISYTKFSQDSIPSNTFYLHERFDSDTLFVLQFSKYDDNWFESIQAIYSLEENEIVKYKNLQKSYGNIRVRGFNNLKVIEKSDEEINFNLYGDHYNYEMIYKKGIGLIYDSSWGIKLINCNIK